MCQVRPSDRLFLELPGGMAGARDRAGAAAGHKATVVRYCSLFMSTAYLVGAAGRCAAGAHRQVRGSSSARPCALLPWQVCLLVVSLNGVMLIIVVLTLAHGLSAVCFSGNVLASPYSCRTERGGSPLTPRGGAPLPQLPQPPMCMLLGLLLSRPSARKATYCTRCVAVVWCGENGGAACCSWLSGRAVGWRRWEGAQTMARAAAARCPLLTSLHYTDPQPGV